MALLFLAMLFVGALCALEKPHHPCDVMLENLRVNGSTVLF